MACLTLQCLETIGLGIKTPIFYFSESATVGSEFASTYHSASQAKFFDGKLWKIGDLASKCSFGNGPQIFNGCGTLTWTVKKQTTGGGQGNKTITAGKTWKQCGLTKGYYIIWVIWSPNTCAKNMTTVWLGKKLKGVDATESYPVSLVIY
jgi:hypothetical protein